MPSFVHAVAAERQELEGFETSGLVRRGKMRPVGVLHAIELPAERTLCGLERARLHVFVNLDFRRCWPTDMCADCRRSSARR